jgi:phosphate/phosphite/phosphonate ABC transporter binding protein
MSGEDPTHPDVEITEKDGDVPNTVGVGIALTTDPHMTRGLLQSLCLALTDATGVEVVPRGVATYSRLLEQLEAGEVDIVWLPPILALRATARERVAPIALPIRNGESSYHAALFSRSDSRIRRIEDLQGLRAAWVDQQSAAGHLIIRAHLEKAGVDLDEAFSENLFVGSHAAVTAAVDAGKADVGATFAYLEDEGHPRRAGWGSRRMQMIASAGPIPNDIIAARSGLSSLLVRLIQSALVDVHNAKLREAARVLLNAEGFAVPTPEHLEPLRDLIAGLSEPQTPHSMFPPPLEP